jgi:hypothetical protein
MLRPQSEAPRLPLERARDLEGVSRTAWWANYGRGGCLAGQELVVEGAKEVK